jgi:ArsR family transcriptional regulator
MLDLMIRGRGDCDMPGACIRGVPGPDVPVGLCVCEFQEQLGLAQSRISYHARILRDAGLILSETRGKWSFYTVDPVALDEALSAFRALFDV